LSASRKFWLLLLPAAAYQCLAIAAELKHIARRRKERRQQAYFQPGVSILKPVRGLDPNTYEAFRSQVRQDYPEFEILFGLASESDPAVHEIRRLQREFPNVRIRLVITGPPSVPNGKVATLIQLAREARYHIWVVNDSDIRVTPSYLSRVVAPLANPEIGVVTCPYRVAPHNAAAAWEALGISTDFIPSALVAELLGVREFGFGSTLAFRAADLRRIGGFEAIADYLADDYQLAKRLTAPRRTAWLSTYIVETALEGASWSGIWEHQLRWAKTIRVSKGRGYSGLFLTHAGVWTLLAFACGAPTAAATLAVLRIASAFLSAGYVLNSRPLAAFCSLAPLWDLYAFAVWLSSFRGCQVRWRDCLFQISAGGRLTLLSPPPPGALLSA
jgi:ceramide glucosyltransferase